MYSFFKNKIKIFLATVLTILFIFNSIACSPALVYASKNKSNDFVFLDEKTLKQEFDKTLNELIEENKYINDELSSSQQELLNKAKLKNLVYMPAYTHKDIFNTQSISMDYLIVEYINQVFDLSIQFYDSNYNSQDVLSKLDDGSISFTSLYLPTSLNINNFLDNDNYYISNAYSSKNLWQISKKQNTYEPFDSDAKIAINQNFLFVNEFISSNDNISSIDPAVATTLLRNDTIDYYITSSYDVYNHIILDDNRLDDFYFTEMLSSNFDVTSHIVTSKNTTDLNVAGLLNIIDKLFNNSSYLILQDYQDKVNNFNKSQVFRASLTDEEVNFISNHSTEEDAILVGITDIPNITSSPDTNGILNSLLEVISSVSGLYMDTRLYTPTSNHISNIYWDLSEGYIDIVPYSILQYSSIIEELAGDDFLFTYPYYRGDLNYYTSLSNYQNNGLENLMYSRIGVSSFEYPYISAHLEKYYNTSTYTLYEYPTYKSMSNALTEGYIDAVITMPGIITNNVDIVALKNSASNTKTLDFSFIVNDDAELLYNILNKSISILNINNLNSYTYNAHNFYSTLTTYYNQASSYKNLLVLIALILTGYVIYSRKALKVSKETISTLSSIDTLTLLDNRTSLSNKLKYMDNYLLCVIKIENFSYINYILTDSEFNNLLCLISNRLKSLQINNPYVPYRISNKEFAVIIESTHFNTDKIASIIKSELTEQVKLNNRIIDLEYSYTFVHSKSMIDRFLPMLHIQILQEKYKNNNDSIAIFSKDDGIYLQDLLDIISKFDDMDSIIQISLSPIHDISKHNAVVGTEVISYLNINDSMYTLSNLDGLSIPKYYWKHIDLYILESLLQNRQKLLEDNIILHNFYFTIKILPYTINHLLHSDLKKLQHKYNIHLFDFIALEITDDILLDAFTLSQVEMLTSIGFRIISVNMIEQLLQNNNIIKFPVHAVKLDSSILPIENDDKLLKLFNNFSSIIKYTNYTVVTDNITSEYQINLLKSKNMNLCQGLYFSNDISFGHLESYINNHKY